LVEALRFQLRETTEVEVSPERLAPSSAALRINRATEVVNSAHARFAVWLEATDDVAGAPGFLLYVVGGRSGRAVVEVVRLPAATDGPDVDRALALKVSEIVESALDADKPAFGSALNAPAAPRVARALPVSPKNSSVNPRNLPVSPKKKPEPEPPPLPPDQVELMVGGVVLSPAGSMNGQLGFRLGLGYVVQTALLQLEVDGSGELLTPQSSSTENGRVRTTEQSFAVGFGILSRGQTQLGAALEGSMRWLHAEGYFGREKTGTAMMLVPTLRLGPELRTALWRQAWLSLSAGGEWTPVERLFSLADAPIADLGRWRADAVLSFVVSIR
jgi:hypothetical protein